MPYIRPKLIALAARRSLLLTSSERLAEHFGGGRAVDVDAGANARSSAGSSDRCAMIRSSICE